MDLEPEIQRPRAVALIGWIWLVFGGYLFFRGILDLVLWKILGPVLPALANAARDQPVGMPPIAAILRFSRVLSMAQILFGGFAFVSAWQLLRLRRPARVAMQAVAYVQLTYFVCFGAFWSWLWPRIAASHANDPSFPSGRYGTVGLIAGLLATAVFAAALVAQIAVLRSAGIRAAFDAAGQPSRE
jgi:hypothetical protein